MRSKECWACRKTRQKFSDSLKDLSLGEYRSEEDRTTPDFIMWPADIHTIVLFSTWLHWSHANHRNQK